MNTQAAQKEDVFVIVQMLADDELGRKREKFEEPLPENYYRAFDLIIRDPHQELMVVKDQGGTRAQIEGVRIRKDRMR